VQTGIQCLRYCPPRRNSTSPRRLKHRRGGFSVVACHNITYYAHEQYKHKTRRRCRPKFSHRWPLADRLHSSTIAAASYTVLRTLMVLLLSRRPRRGDDEEVSNRRRSRRLLAAGGFVVLAYLRNAHSQPKSASTSPHSRLECEVPTHQTAPAGTSAASSQAGDAADVLSLAWG